VLAGVPFAIAGVLAISSVAFAATVVRPMIVPDAPAQAGALESGTPALGSNPTVVLTPTPDATSAATPTPLHQTSAPTSVASTHSIAGMGTLNAADNIDGTLTFTWTAFIDAPFSGYLLEYEPTSAGRTPSPDSPHWATAATDAVTVTVAGIASGDYQVRIQAVSTLDGVAEAVAETDAIHVHLSAGHGLPSQAPTLAPTLAPTQAPTQAPTASSAPTPAGIVGLGTVGVADNIDGTLTFTWTAFTDAPFSGYLLEYELTSAGKVPTIDSPRWATASTVATSAKVAGIGPGDYQVRIQAVSTLGGVARVLGQTVVIHVHLSAGHPTSSASPTPVPAS
jgi:hypothetical protein